MQNTMLDSTISCIPSTLNFVCDVDGVHTEIPIPSSAWDFENETVWLTQAQLAELYKVNVPAVSKQIQNVFEDEELQEDSVISILEITAADGKCYQWTKSSWRNTAKKSASNQKTPKQEE